MYLASYIIFFATYIALICCKGVRRTYPANVIILSVFTLSLSIFIGSVAVYHDAIWVMTAIGITAAICLGLTLFAMQTKYDFTGNSNSKNSRRVDHTNFIF